MIASSPPPDLDNALNRLASRSPFPPLLSALRFLIEKFREYRKDHHLYVAFIDPKATFDTTDFVENMLWNILWTLVFLWKNFSGVRHRDYELIDLTYADLERTHDIFNEVRRLSAARKPKPKLMYVGDGPDLSPIIIGNDPVGFVTCFVYLCWGVSNTDDLLMEINRKRGLAVGVTSGLRKQLWQRRDITYLYNTAVRYSIWRRNPELLNSWLRITHAQDHRRNALVLSCVQRGDPPELWSVMNPFSAVRWLGHVLRVIYHFGSTSENRGRPQGKLRNRWKDAVRHNLQQVNLALDDVPTLCQDRESWRSKVDFQFSTPS